MIRITGQATKFRKKAGNWLDNAKVRMRIPESDYKVKRGHESGTYIDAKHLPEFYLWLSPETRKMVLNNTPIQEIESYVKSYVKSFPMPVKYNK